MVGARGTETPSHKRRLFTRGFLVKNQAFRLISPATRRDGK
jgi:hypothetical protein